MAQPSEDARTHVGMDLLSLPGSGHSIQDMAERLQKQLFEEPAADPNDSPEKPLVRSTDQAEEEASVRDASSDATEQDGEQLEGDDQANDETPKEGGEAEAEAADTINTLAGVAEVFDVEEAEFLDTVTLQNTDGEDFTLTQVIEAWREQPGAAGAIAEREANTAQLATERTQLRETHDTALSNLAQLAQAHHRILVGQQLPESETARLRESDPEAYNAYRLHQMEGRELLQRTLDAITQETDKRSAEDASGRQAMIETNFKEVQRAWPALQDQKTAVKVEAQLRQYLGGIGFAREEMDSVTDPRLYRILRDALRGSALSKNGSKKLAAARDKGLRRPTTRPKARGEDATPGMEREARAKGLTEAHRKSQSVESAAALLKNLI